MGSSFIKILLLCLLSSMIPLIGESPETSKILYLMHTGETKDAIKLYQNYSSGLGHHDRDLIQQMCLALLDQGFRSDDQEKQLLTLFGAGASLNEGVLYILEEGANHKDPEVQLLSLNFLAKFQTDTTETLLAKAMSSKYLPIRLEAIYHLAQKKHPRAIYHAESLMAKVPAPALPLFPQIFAASGTTDAITIMQRLLSHADPQVRVAAIVSSVKYGRDDLLPKIRLLSSQHDPIQQEACAVALGALKDETSAPLLETMAQSSAPNVRLAALLALYRLGRKEARSPIEELATQGDIFAITALSEMAGSEETLYKITHNADPQMRINATLALLEREDPRALETLNEVLIRRPNDLAFHQASSVGRSLYAYKVIGSAAQNLEGQPMAHELSLLIREQALTKSLNISDKAFITLAKRLLSAQQNDIIPTVVNLLENLQTEEAIALLREYQQQAGAPLIRSYCNLALYNLKEAGPFEENLYNWINEKCKSELISFRPVVTREAYGTASPYQLNPKDTSKLLVESFEAVASSQSEQGIDTLLHAIGEGHDSNKYALAGLLMRATQ